MPATTAGRKSSRASSSKPPATTIAFLANLERAGLSRRVRHLRAFSTEAFDAVEGPVDVLFVDGAHRYGAARTDLRRWGARVPLGGTLLVHDAFSSIGVTAAIARELLASPRLRYRGRVGSLATYSAEALPSVRARLVNAGRQLAELPWFLRNLMVKAWIVAGRAARRTGGQEGAWPY